MNPEISQELANLAGKPADKFADELYPCDVRGIGDDWQAINLLTSRTGTRYSRNYKYSYTLAEREAWELKETTPISYEALAIRSERLRARLVQLDQAGDATPYTSAYKLGESE